MAAYVRRNNDNCEYGGARHNCHKSYHFTDIPIQEDHYGIGFVGETDSDVVHAINAAITVLQGSLAPAPFNIPSDAEGRIEAFRLLAHFVGDIHQPLHVGAIYLDENGQPLNPDKTGYDPATNTVGGNSLKVGASSELHLEWDKISPSLANENLVDEASKIPVTPGPLENWATTWASESVLLAQTAYSGLSFGAKEAGGKQNSFDWPISFDDRSNYLKTEREIQRKQIINAGARLAHVLKAIWPN